MNVLILGPPFHKINSSRRGLGAVLVNVKTTYAYVHVFMQAKVKVKQSHYTPGQALRFPEG